MKPPPHPAPHLVSFHRDVYIRLRMSRDLTLVEARGGKRARAGLRTSPGVQGIDLFTLVGHSGILRHLCPSAFQPRSGLWDQKAQRPMRAKKAHKGSNFQEVDGRSHIGSGLAWRRTTDYHDSHQFPTLQLKNRQPFSQITNGKACSCSCISRKPCYHMTGCQERETAAAYRRMAEMAC
jgi:hypothetical protein